LNNDLGWMCKQVNKIVEGSATQSEVLSFVSMMSWI